MESKLKMLFLFFFLPFINSLVSQSISPLSSDSEWRALLNLRSSLAVSAKNWPKKNNPCLNWAGIECVNGRVTRINLSGLRRTRVGKLNPRFGLDSLPSFTMLSSFNSSGFSLPGSIPDWFGQRLSNLQVLDLSSSSIYGSIPSSIGSLSRLSSLYLSDNSITGIIPAALGKLVSLSVLDLSQNLLAGGIPGEISGLGNLSILDLSSNFLSGSIPAGFGSLSGLKMLNLSNNSISSSIPPQLGNLSQLIELDVEHNSLMGSLPNELGRLRKLRKLLVGNNELEGSLVGILFQNLTQLEYLSLSRNNFEGNIPFPVWSAFPHLKYLDVSGNNLTGVFPNLNASFNITGANFNFSNNLFYGNLVSWVRKVQMVDVSSNYFEGSLPNDTKNIVLFTNNCFSSLPGQRDNETCRIFYSERGLTFGNNSSHEKLQPRLVENQKSERRKRLKYIIIVVSGGLGVIIAIVTGLFFLLKKCSIGGANNDRGGANVRSVEGASEPPPPNVHIDFSTLGELFMYEQILQATGNFSSENLIKNGHSGDLFWGTLEDGNLVVIKKVDLLSVRKESFMLELDFFGKVTHRRFVPLVGHCLDGENEKILVYKYMPNGDLSNSFYRSRNIEKDEEDDVQSLDWITRLKIAIGAAEALSYLHHECTPPIVHRDIQASSILLDDRYEVRLGSLSEVSVQGNENTQNKIIRLLRTPQNSGKGPSGSSSTTCAYDVYCFGKVLLELVTGKPQTSSKPNNSDSKQFLDTTLPYISPHDKELVTKIVDPSLIVDDDLLEEVWAVAIVAKSCLNPKPSRRPSMRHVLKALENPFKVVREESFSSGRLRRASSRQSWSGALFGSWKNSSSENSNVSRQTNREIIGGLRLGSRGSGGNDNSSSLKRSSSDVFPEPVEVERREDN